MGSEDYIFLSILLGWLIWGFIIGIVCRKVVESKGYLDDENYGFSWGFWLGLIGLIVCAVKPPVGEYANKTVVFQQPGNNQATNTDKNDSNNAKADDSDEYWICSCGTQNESIDSFCYNCFKEKPIEETASEETTVKKDNQYESSITRQIKEISKLKEEGFITEEEYEAKKKQILGI